MEQEEGCNSISAPYEIQRSPSMSQQISYIDNESQATESELHYYEQDNGATSVQGSSISSPIFKDCTSTVHKMHNLLLYLLSNPDEFEQALTYYKSKSTTSTLPAFHADFDRATDVGSVFNGDDDHIPVPFMVFAPDAEVVLPQAHTASQLFGYERDVGIELEATSGMIGLCQLFMRWLALMPGGDHTNLIHPPGLTVMRIAGGRYRVTAAHRVLWTWNNEFLLDPASPNTNMDEIHVGDLVAMTIVDVFETDCDGKLLSYCPTFDNRAIRKTDQTVERIRKSSSRIKKNIDIVTKSKTAARVNRAACLFGQLSYKAAVRVKDEVQKKMAEDQSYKVSKFPPANNSSPSDVKDVHAFERALSVADGTSNSRSNMESTKRAEHYISDDDTTTYDER